MYYAEGGYSLWRDLDIKKVVIEDGVTSLTNNLFYGCTGITSVTLPDSVTSIGYEAFGDCTSLTSITLPNSVKRIDDGAFQHCTSLTEINIPDSVKKIDDHSFGYFYNEDKDDYDKLEGFTISGCKGSEAEKYAKDDGFKFIELKKEQKPFLLGDVNNDGNIDVEDAVMVIGQVNGNKALTDNELKYADVDKNDVIDIEDAVAIIAHVNGLKPLDRYNSKAVRLNSRAVFLLLKRFRLFKSYPVLN